MNASDFKSEDESLDGAIGPKSFAFDLRTTFPELHTLMNDLQHLQAQGQATGVCLFCHSWISFQASS